MKCPKCHYLSFDPEPRCRNCGYTLELDPDLVIHPSTEETAGQPLADLSLRDEPFPKEGPELPRPREIAPVVVPPTSMSMSAAAGPAVPMSGRAAPAAPPKPPVDDAQEVRPARPTPRPTPPARPKQRQPAPATTELPLFVKRVPRDTVDASEEAPVPGEVSTAAEESWRPEPPLRNTPPLSVRRGSAEASRVPERKLGPLDHDLLEGLERLEDAERRSTAERERAARIASAAGARLRLSAAAIDGGLLAVLAALVVTVTLEWTGLSWADWLQLPLVPVAAFVLLLVVAYLFMFTAVSGQTAGKMVMHIRVVNGGASAGQVSMGQALVRALIAVPSVLLAGAGFVPALVGEQRAVHDRVADTRVVRA